MGESPLFSVIIDTYYRPALLRLAVGALRRQTYGNLDIILVNNGATAETIDYLYEVEAADKRVKLIHFPENRKYLVDSPDGMVQACYSAGLHAATGDYVFHQADDDLMADDYVEKMVALFQGHPNCTTAAGRPVSINLDGERLDPEPRSSNYRSRYTPGHLVVLDYLRGGAMFSAAGEVFAIRREVLIAAGGYRCAVEEGQLYGIVPFGTTGFDETALFYWRRHDGQLNRALTASGSVGVMENLNLLRDCDIKGRWRAFGEDVAQEVVARIETRVLDGAAGWVLTNLHEFRPRSSFRIVTTCYRRPLFWRGLLRRLWARPMTPVSLAAKWVLRAIFHVVPRRVPLTPRIEALRSRVIR